jgi:hypothetical protein
MEKLGLPPTDVAMKHWRVRSSVADPCHFGVDPDPRIHASDYGSVSGFGSGSFYFSL